MSAPTGRPLGGSDGIRLRLATPEDLPACGETWREGLNDYFRRLHLPEIPPELGPIGRLHAHALGTDPERFVVATRPDPDGPRGERVVAFGSAVVRESVWFLSMLFIRPREQGSGLGRAMLGRILPPIEAGLVRATGTDSAQPISNALYAGYGIVPRMPLFSLVGRPGHDDALPPLPSGVAPVPFDRIAAGPPDGPGHRELVTRVDALDRELVGFAHPQDHRFLRTEGRTGFLYRGPDGAPLGYGYTSRAGRVGPIAVRDRELLPAVLGHLLTAVEPAGASAVWIPGAADRAFTALLQAGLRIEGFPVLLCWTDAFADFSRYVPISPGLL